MNRKELQQALSALGISEYDYYLVGASRHGLQGHGELVLDRDGTRWVTYTYERGKAFDHKYFDSEDEACAYMLNELAKPASVETSLTPEQEDEARRLKDRRITEYESWLRAEGRDPKTGHPTRE